MAYLTTEAMIFVFDNVSTRHIRPKANVKNPDPSADSHVMKDEQLRTTRRRDDSHTSHARHPQRGIVEPVTDEPNDTPPDRNTRCLSYAQFILLIW